MILLSPTNNGDAEMIYPGLFSKSLIDKCIALFQELSGLGEDDRINAINILKIELHKHSPMTNEPVDCVLWVKGEEVASNDYNPNSVAPPEMKLLTHSVSEDGFTQPIVVWRTTDKYEVVDGYHRNRVGKEVAIIRERLHGYLPITVVNEARTDRGDRIASTIRHNRARGKHRIDGMSEIVVELKRRNWSDIKIAKELGMDPDEVLRLTQITGLAEMFSNKEFSQSWEAAEVNTINESDDLSLHKENIPALQPMGGLERGNVSGDTVSDTTISGGLSIKTSKDASTAKNSNAKRNKKMAYIKRSKSKQSSKKQRSLARAGIVLYAADGSRLPDKTGLEHSKRKPASPCKRRGRFSDL